LIILLGLEINSLTGKVGDSLDWKDALKIKPFMNVQSCGKKRLSKWAGCTLIELLAVMLIVVLATAAYVTATKNHGMGMGIAAAVAGGMVGFAIIAFFYCWAGRREKMRLAKLRADYVWIYRVLAVPGNDQPTIMLEGAEIRVGDHGWEAAPLVENGLIYLQGLTPDWRTVWHAGFRPDQIERVGPKPSSQYDHWVPDWAKPQPVPCPFPIQSRESPSMNRPHHRGQYGLAYPQPYTGKMVAVKRTL
jgi:hypothetical protein